MVGHMAETPSSQRRFIAGNVTQRVLRRLVLLLADLGMMILFVGQALLRRHQWARRIVEPVGALMLGLITMIFFALRWWDSDTLYD